MDEDRETRVEGLFKVKGKGRDENVAGVMDSENVEKVRSLEVGKGTMSFWNGMLGLVTFFFSQRHKMI